MSYTASEPVSLVPTATEAMQPRFFSTAYGSFVRREWDGRNRSGIQPACDKVVVLVDQAAGHVGSIEIPDHIRDRQGLGATTGVLVAVGPQAFAYDSLRIVRWEGERPEPGSRVFFTKYAGQEYTGHDGLMYRLMEDRSIGGIELPDPAAEQGEQSHE